jgi:hypothetical protein
MEERKLKIPDDEFMRQLGSKRLTEKGLRRLLENLAAEAHTYESPPPHPDSLPLLRALLSDSRWSDFSFIHTYGAYKSRLLVGLFQLSPSALLPLLTGDFDVNLVCHHILWERARHVLRRADLEGYVRRLRDEAGVLRSRLPYEILGYYMHRDDLLRALVGLGIEGAAKHIGVLRGNRTTAVVLGDESARDVFAGDWNPWKQLML